MPIILDYEQMERARKKRAKRLSPVRGQAQAERELRQRLGKLWERVLFPAAKEISEAIKEGASPAEVSEIITRTLEIAERQYDIESQDVVWRWMSTLDRDSREALRNSLGKAMSVDISAILDPPEMKDALAVGSLEAVNLIRTIPQEFFGRVSQAVMDNFTGKPLPAGRSLLQQIRAISGQTKKRAKVIARDQSKKINATFNQARQESLGIDTYIWRTVKDRRVVGNPSGVSPVGNKAHGDHWSMEGMLCRWDDPTVYSKDNGKTWIKRKSDMPKNHPGQDIQCRCHAEPVINIDKILAHTEVA